MCAQQKDRKVQNLNHGNCVKGKLCKFYFRTVNHSSKGKYGLMDLVHTDLMVPFNERSWEGAVYIVEESTRYIRTFMLKSKSDVFQKFVACINQTETYTGQKLKCIRSDNDTEFKSAQWEV